MNVLGELEGDVHQFGHCRVTVCWPCEEPSPGLRILSRRKDTERGACRLNQRVLGSSPSASTISSAADLDYHPAVRLRTIALCVLLCACTDQPPQPQAAGPMQIAEIAGRVAGPAQQCVTLRPSESVRTTDSDRHVLLYGSGRTIWVNHLGSCGFGTNDALLIERTGSDLCRGEIIRSFDATTRIPGPACILGDFVPYTR